VLLEPKLTTHLSSLPLPFLSRPRLMLDLDLATETDPETFDLTHLPSSALEAVEADSFWCLSKLLDGIQDNYIFAQPGIQRSVRKMAELVGRIDRTSEHSC
jgi:hypothetical protein